MQQSQEIPEQRLTAASELRAKAEHVEWAEMLHYSERLVAEYQLIEEYFARQATLLSIPMEIGVAMTMSEGQVRRILSAAERLRAQTPAEADLFDERAEAGRSQRRVDIEHGDDAMSWLNAYLPSHVAAAIDKRLTVEARKIHDDRTLAHRRADLLASWLTTNEHGEIALGADIAVTIGANTLLGHGEDPAIAADGSFVVPARWVTDDAANPFWHSILTGTGGNVLEHRYHGRFAPEILKKALIFTHGTCRAPTCTTPADRCQFDHRQPWPHGPTTGDNMWPLCERHHQMKSHRVITWTLPSGQQVAA